MSILYDNRNTVGSILKILPYIVGGMLYLLFSLADGVVFPVVTDFTITKSYTVGDDRLMGGYFIKSRSCRFITVEAVGTTTELDKRLIVEFTPDSAQNSYSTIDKPKGSYNWGDWRISYSDDVVDITLYAFHECNSLWITKTKLIVYKAHPGVVKNIAN